jgi:hypothetical protein
MYLDTLYFKYPFAVGNSWTTPSLRNNYDTVFGKFGAINLDTSIYTNAYLIAHSLPYIVNTSARDTFYYKPYVGAIFKRQMSYSLGGFSANGSYQLISYNLK